MSNQIAVFRCRNGDNLANSKLTSFNDQSTPPNVDYHHHHNHHHSSEKSSLARIVHLFQLFGISFGGVDFRGRHRHRGDGTSDQSTDPPPTYSIRQLWIIWSVLFMAGICGVVVIGFLYEYVNESSYSQFMHEMSHTKPILNYLVNSVIYLFAVNNIIAFLYLSFYGGRALVVHLSDRTILDGDQNHQFARSVTMFTVCYVGVVSFTGIVSNIYIRKKNHPEEAWWPDYLINLLFKVVIHYLSLSGILCLCVMVLYIVHAYSQQIKSLRTESAATGLNLSQLIQIKRTVTRLECHFDRTTKLIQQLVLLNVIIGTWTLIGSLCMLLIIPSLSTFRFTSFVLLLFTNWMLVFGVFIFYGNRVHQEYQQLLHHIRNRVQVWNIQNLLYFQRLSSTSTSQFQLRLYRTFSLNQTVLISLSTFILNYIVLLIQTDHSKSADLPSSNSTHTLTTTPAPSA